MKQTKSKSQAESVQEFLARGGSVKRLPTPKYKSSGKTRFSFKDVGKGPGEM